jgi:hypothetical protein
MKDQTQFSPFCYEFHLCQTYNLLLDIYVMVACGLWPMPRRYVVSEDVERGGTVGRTY